MKQVGLITFFDHPNYGAVLQAYGMKYALEKLGCYVTFIKNARALNGVALEKDRNQRVLAALRHRRNAFPPKKTFTDFSEKYFRTEELYDRHDINSEYDFFIVGSDQVWNIEITGNDPFWFLDFALPEKRFSYAASFGMDCLPENYLPWYREMLAGFTNLSVRETTGQTILRELIGKEAAVCPDPVLLPECRVWEDLMTTVEKTVVLYMTEFDAELYQYAKADAIARELPLTVLSNTKLPLTDIITICSPESWLGNIENAAVVYSNSFHALVFSHIFHKELRIKPLVRMKNRNGRLFSFIESMQESLAEEENRPGLFCLKGSGNWVDWEKVDSQLNVLRYSGLNYLQDIINAHETGEPHVEWPSNGFPM